MSIRHRFGFVPGPEIRAQGTGRCGGRALSGVLLGFVMPLLAAPSTARAHEVYASLVPNPVTAMNSEGRIRPCITCHNNPDGGAGCGMMPCLNPFGMSFRANMFRWNAALAAMDSDGDGFTNGQELQDAFGSWVDGPYPGVASLVTPPGNPGFAPGDMDPDRDRYCAFGRDLNMDGDCRDAGENEGSFDCNEMASSIHSGATELCTNTADDDCDGLATLVDPECAGVVDADGDGRCVMGTDADGDRNCADPGEGSASIVDCDDTRANVYFGARENCADTVDNDCDGLTDLADGQCQGDSDVDGDGYCPVGQDLNGDGDCVDGGEVIVTIGDCDDENVAINPDASENASAVCGDTLDNDCDGMADLNDLACRTFRDDDRDGYCPTGRDVDADGDCTGPTDLADGADCDDGNALRNPGLTEQCLEMDGNDEDCDGAVNLADTGMDGRTDSTCNAYRDIDGDGYCSAGPDRNRDGDCVDPMELGANDCDEASPVAARVNPTAEEICVDGVDNDCDGSADASDPACIAYRDEDRDGYCALGRDMNGDFDCADTDEQTADVDSKPTDPTVYPGAPENCLDMKDNDQDGLTDEADPQCTRETDADGDGFCPLGRDDNMDGDCTDARESSRDTDCNDGDAMIRPGATEICGSYRDENCNGDVDADDPDCFYLLDRDHDGFCGLGVDDNRDGDCTDEAEDRFGEDCDDTMAAVNPNAMEICDNASDDDCDRAIDGLDTQCACRVDADCVMSDPCIVGTCRSAGRGCEYSRLLACIDTGPVADAGADAAGPGPSGGCAASPRADRFGVGLWALGFVAAYLAAQGLRRRRLARLAAGAGILALLILAPPSTALAFGTYPALVPNGSDLGCLTCHQSSGGGNGVDVPACAGSSTPCLVSFGTAFRTNGFVWNATLAAIDSDGDGWTNGQELLDPSGSWVTGSANPGPAGEERLPGFHYSACGSFPSFSLSCAMNDCTLNYDNCDGSPDACVESNPYFSCNCPSGYSGSGVGSGGCSNINECAFFNYCNEDTAGSGNICSDYAGGFNCTCNTPEWTASGSEPLGERCNDTNECTGGNPCLEDTVAGNTCTNSAGRFDCTCGAAGYQLNNNGGYPESCSDINECTAGNPCNEDIPGSGNVCSNVPGRYDCTACGPGFVLANNGMPTETCADVNECSTMPGVCGLGTCMNTLGSYSCSCPTGYRFSFGTCTEINECVEMPGVCGVGTCSNTPAGAYTCTCPMGYNFNGVTCQLADACNAGLDDCDANATCTPIGASSWSCACLSGFTGNGHLPPPRTDTGCTDIDECVTMPGVCGVGACRNATGSYMCNCPTGYTAPALGGTCTDVNECMTMPGVCGIGSCTNIGGSYTCGCPPGYSAPATGGTCSDIDECRTSSTCNATSGWGFCTNTLGGYSCSCNAGYGPTGSGLSLTCTNIDECTVAPPCGVGTCADRIGSYACTCPVGYTGPAFGGTCSDVDECADGATCSASLGFGTCSNDPGAFTCSCNTGFELTGSARTANCANVDECALGTDTCDVNASCTDAVPAFGAPAFRCVCNAPAWEGDGMTCTDADECADASLNDCSPLATCDNQVGSYGCTCTAGYEGNGFECVDIDECSRTPAPCATSEVCINQTGMPPLCECRPGFARPMGGGPCETACGNSIRGVGEECDDGNTNVGDGCDASCRVERGYVCVEEGGGGISRCDLVCGNGIVDTSAREECDDGDPAMGGMNSNSTPDACRVSCVRAYCGDGVADTGEECDDAERNSALRADACRPDCRRAFCGDGVLDEGEYCDRTPGTEERPIAECTTACLPDGGMPDGGGGDVSVVTDGGCACRAGTSGPGRALFVALVALAALVWRRRGHRG